MEIFNQNPNTFGDLPQALINELLEKSQGVGKTLFDAFNNVQKKKSQFREGLKKLELLRRDTDFDMPTPPTTCGIDGSCAKEELLSVDLLAAAAVALEGLIPPSEKRYWEEPRHKVFIKEENHSPETYTILRGVMIGYEQILAEKAPHDVVFIDGSLTTPLIHLNQALSMAKSGNNKNLKVSKKLFDIISESLTAYSKTVGNIRSDKLWVGMPKYTTHREVGAMLNWGQAYDDRALLTLVLTAGELTKPIDFEQPEQPWHLSFESSRKDIEVIKDALSTLKVMYYKPHDWTPALRIELNTSAAANDYQIAMVLQAIKYQCSTPGIFEPYPLFIADRMAKSLGIALPAFRQVATRQMAEDYSGDIGEVLLSMQGYRTEKDR
ncbi:DNA double-strand break repair nuclease NurA [Thermodesulfovibrionales bacterium]|nr:DNA double-strand break repair nuclease NurA [Thermodesulfovibrionales bacterium]